MIVGRFEPDNLIAGSDYPLVATAVIVHGPDTEGETEFKRGDVIAFTSESKPVLVDSEGQDGEGRAVGIMCDDVTVKTGEQITTNMYIKGEFNQRALRFGGADIVDKHRQHMNEIGLVIRETRR